MRPMTTIAAAMLLSATMMATAHAQGAVRTIIDMFGNLDASDPRDGSNRPYEQYWMDLQAGNQVRVRTVRQGSFDPLVEVFDTNGSLVVRNDDGGGDLNALATFTAGRTGRYFVRVHGYAGSMGGYRILAEQTNAGPIGGGPVAPYRLIGQQSMSFNDSVPRLSNGSHYHDYLVSMSAGQELVFNMDSSAFDSYLYVFDANNLNSALVTNDDSNGSLNATILFRAPRTGNYIVRASQLSHGDGNYVLRARRLSPF